MCRSIAFLVALAVTASGAGAQNIGLFFDPSGATCSASVTPGVTRTLYILASPGGPTFGLTGYEFRVVGMPDGWVQSVVANPAANVVIGDPFGAVGANGAFGGFAWRHPSCRSSRSSSHQRALSRTISCASCHAIRRAIPISCVQS